MELRDIEISLKTHFRHEQQKLVSVYAYLLIFVSLFFNVAINHMINYYESHKEQIYVYDKSNKYDFSEIEGIKNVINNNVYKVKVHTPSFSDKYNGIIYLMSQDNYEINNGRDLIYKDEIVCSDKFAPDDNINLFNLKFTKNKLYLNFYHRLFKIDQDLKVNVVGTYDSKYKINDSNVCYASKELLNEIGNSKYSYNTGYYVILNNKDDRHNVIKQLKKRGYKVKRYEDDSFKYEKLGTLLLFMIWFNSLIVLIREVHRSITDYKNYVKSDSFIDENYLGIELFNHQLSQFILFIFMVMAPALIYYYMEYIFTSWVFLDLEYLNINIPFNWLGYMSILLIVTIYPMIAMNWFNIKYYITCKKHGRVLVKK